MASTQPQRSPATLGRVLGRARVRPEHVRHVPSLAAGHWYDVVQPADPTLTSLLEGYVWIDLNGRPRYLPAQWLEIELEVAAT
jgi:hypothetical protein